MSHPFVEGYFNKEAGFWSEYVGGGTGTVTGGIGGGALGAALGGIAGGGEGAAIGTAVGSTAGLYLPAIVGSLLALTTDTRDTREQAEADKDTLKNLLVPGVAPYNYAKRLGYAIRNPELKKEQLNLSKEKKNKKQEEE